MPASRLVPACRGRMVFAASVSFLPMLAISGLQAAEPKRGGSLSISLESDLPTLDPIGFASFNDRQAGVTIYDTLLDIDSNGKIVPNLAEKMDTAPDATSFRLTLHSGVKFHDGTPLDGEAVVAHFRCADGLVSPAARDVGRSMSTRRHCPRLDARADGARSR